MKLILILSVLMLSRNPAATQLSLPELRQLYLEAVESEVKTQQFMNYMNSINHDDPLMHGYFASAQALVSKHASKPSDKLKNIRLAAQSFEAAISKNPKDAELRFLRFSVQHNLPRFLGFSGDLNDDLEVILQNISETKSLQEFPEWLNTVVNYIMDSGRCSDAMLAQLKSALK